ncbi:Xaa-Pro dipeptidyl-peptidase [Kitasatospora sp. NBC_01287]|uniref:Xaa-Pro dipeptidyl-peptidase n=1 Tax=Kitasatospora sp. NBC_01287 TaxID=2903573 RepID=UPI002253CF65|nr:Xaa-Pro dipeptidyl-peptidase [Kitasatospora sp. NBC_01287]MCX4750239.1 Xaa-Pro dipeptidyl-peptidase [Kitasatospora sp. NBC_01287]
MRTHRIRSVAGIATVLLALAAALLSPVSAAWAGTVRDGASQPTYSYANAIRETVWVDTGLDTNGDGHHDRVAADIIRPSEAAQAGIKVPVIMDASPYYECCGRGNESQLKTYDSQGHPVQFPLYYDNYFVPRGYAVVLVDLAGTNRSDGCVDVGGTSDVTSAKAVIDWLNGRANGYSTRTGASTVNPTWTNGSVGMIGKSWDGTIANGVAATGVAGLKTIVPISAISSWYDYYRSQGAPLYSGTPADLASEVEDPTDAATCGAEQKALAAGSPSNGDWSAAWQQRDYVANASKVTASVFVVHGMQDLNVRDINFGQWWNALASTGVDRKIWLSQTGHVDPFDYRRGAWVDTLHQWFDHYLMGVDNGIQNQPVADIERAPDQWTTEASWPAPGTVQSAVHLNPGALGGSSNTGKVSFTDDPTKDENTWAAEVDQSTSEKAAFTTAPLTQDLQLSGSGSVTLTVSSSTSSAHLSAVLVDLGPATIRNYQGDGEGITTLTTRSCWGDSTAGDSACYLDTAADTTQVNETVFSRGWADLGHYAGLDHTVRLTPNTPYTMTLQLAPSDHVIPAGHRLALIVAGTDDGLINPPSTRPKLTVDLTRSALTLPLVGGAGQLPAGTPTHPRSTAAASGPTAPAASAPVAVAPRRPAGLGIAGFH